MKLKKLVLALTAVLVTLQIIHELFEVIMLIC